MRTRRSVSVSRLLAVVAILTGPGHGAAQNMADHQYSTSDIEAGARVYVANCQLCHGSNGDGVNGVDLRQGRFPTARSDEDIRRVVTTGVGGSRMPSFPLRATELDGIIAYIRAGFDPSGVAAKVGDPARGQALFESEGRCNRCHQVNGQGARRPAPDLGEIGVTRSAGALQRTILDPAAALLPINRPIRAVTRDGTTVRGRRLNEDTYTVQLIDSDGRLRSFVKAELVEYEVSLVPTMRPTTLSADQVADLIGYLLSLRGLP